MKRAKATPAETEDVVEETRAKMNDIEGRYVREQRAVQILRGEADKAEAKLAKVKLQKKLQAARAWLVAGRGRVKNQRKARKYEQRPGPDEDQAG